MLTLLEKARLIDDEHTIATKVLDHIAAAHVTNTILIPEHMAEHPLCPPRPGIADLFSQLPAVLAPGIAKQPFQVHPGLPTWFSTHKLAGNPAEQLIKP